MFDFGSAFQTAFSAVKGFASGGVISASQKFINPERLNSAITSNVQNKNVLPIQNSISRSTLQQFLGFGLTNPFINVGKTVAQNIAPSIPQVFKPNNSNFFDSAISFLGKTADTIERGASVYTGVSGAINNLKRAMGIDITTVSEQVKGVSPNSTFEIPQWMLGYNQNPFIIANPAGYSDTPQTVQTVAPNNQDFSGISINQILVLGAVMILAFSLLGAKK